MTVPQEIAEAIVDPKAYSNWTRVHDAFRWLRLNAPLTKAAPSGYEPFWAVTRHADILEIERQSSIFRNGEKAITLTSLEQGRRVRELTNGSPHLLRTLVHMDAPDHPVYRRLAQAKFLRQNLGGLEGRVREIAREAVERMAEFGGRCDFAQDVAFLYPLRVIMELMGVPRSDEALMLKLTQEVFGNQDPEVNRSKRDVTPAKIAEDQQKTFAEFMEYFAAITEDRRRSPREDLASVIANAEINGAPISQFEAMSYYIIVATAGHDTTSSSTASGLWALAEHPEELAKLKARGELIPGHVEESIRWETPVKHFMRTAVVDAEVAGHAIAKNDWLMLCYPSGNRDEAVFEDPYAYRIDRTPNKHVAFGFGAHVCLGQHLARMEMRVLWEELLPRLRNLELDGAPSRTAANFVCGPKNVPIRYELT